MIPNLYVESIYAINLHELKDRGIKTVIVDLDNTLVESTRPEATPKLIKWLAQLKGLGFQVMIVSNNNRNRVSTFASPLQIPFIYTAKKPLTLAFKRALKKMGSQKEETVVIGDQLLTDVFGGNRMGIYTILVTPVCETDGYLTRVNRRIERLLFRWMEKKGLLSWEEKH
ncbi:YqeG family HAD IIIA-type phosphatase [Hazenella sp. IB182357]|uniref:YqeG family HAD IIIA-type phosphatase n=1 Tax=Polycladospora coralii TaxID=2771432 RepID=A0A926RUW1_9BACL|nr:YqeG family HAD IIIA-type phosphatase [Polycladospora coralii]MBD1372869.1 YqeG family HAD IIIA-type phosphatase [Polycladospora coralii]MBS7529442.1 YqeG family HAD IIIA-type phosphatase [Polycladospora coralii]